MDVEAISRGREEAMLSDGSTIPVTSWVGDDGFRCAKDVATMAIAGPDKNGKWWMIRLIEFTTYH